MNVTRRTFLKDAFVALGFLPLPGGVLFAAPPDWKPEKQPNLVFGVVSDTHLRTSNNGNGHGANWPDKHFVAALQYFKSRNVDAIVHCGDMAHRGQTREMEFHAMAWRKVFADGHAPVKLFVTGNHDVEGARYGDFVKKRYPDPAVRANHVLSTDMAGNWERIWGEKYEPVLHKVVKGYHFFGRNWDTPETAAVAKLKEFAGEADVRSAAKPFFYFQHTRPSGNIRGGLLLRKGGVAFFGHNHWSISNWNMAYLYHGKLPVIECASCEPRGCSALVGDAWITKVPIGGREAAGKGRQGYLVRLYDDMMVIERHEFTNGESSLGADWVMPLGMYEPHPFAKDELKKAIGEPQFREGAKLSVELVHAEAQQNKEKNPDTSDKGVPASTNLHVRIPLADGNAKSRVYAYEVIVAGEGKQASPTPEDSTKTNARPIKLRKAVYATGCNMGIGHEPKGGITELTIPKSELPPSETLTIAVRPLTSLGTFGKPIATEFTTGTT